MEVLFWGYMPDTFQVFVTKKVFVLKPIETQCCDNVELKKIETYKNIVSTYLPSMKTMNLTNLQL